MTHKALATSVLLLSTFPALASGGEGGTPSPFAGDLGSALWTLVIFIIVIFVLGKFAWGPILGALQKREDFIRDSLESAKKDREQSEAKLKEYTEQLTAARAEAKGIVEEGRRDAETVQRKIEDSAKKESTALIERARREIQIATDSAVKDLYDLSGKLATDIASRIIRKELNAAEHERLIAESIDELSKVHRN